MSLSALLERVEACQGPDREIDCLIFEWERPEYDYHQRGVHYGEYTGEYFRLGDVVAKAPAYSASVDAALALIGWVLPGWVVHLHISDRASACWLTDAMGHDTPTFRAPTPALALCAALLAAMIGEEAKPFPPSTVTP